MVDSDYQSALKLLYDRINYERTSHAAYTTANYRLDRMRELLGFLDDPHRQYPIIHVAGTKGKGTTANLIYDGLRACGIRAGLYTSPHLVRIEERFQFDGRLCNQSEMISLVHRALAAAEKVEQKGLGRPTFFEITTAMGMLYFAENRADSVVLEVGLGGRLDSTNVCQPILSIITSISLDHQAQLGSTISLIAGEKAGIIKPKVPVICSARHEDARTVIQRVADAQTAPLWLIERDYRVDWKAVQFDSNGESSLGVAAQIRYQSLQQASQSIFDSMPFPVSMLGRHQADNVAAALTALNWLACEAGWQLDPARIRDAYSRSQLPGRLQIVGSRPWRIVDAAHNPASVLAGIEAIAEHFGGIPTHVVFASSKDKDYRSMMSILLARCCSIHCTAFQKNPRAVKPAELDYLARQLAEEMTGSQRIPPRIQMSMLPEQAWNSAIAETEGSGLVLAIGSFFLAAELLEPVTVS